MPYAPLTGTANDARNDHPFYGYLVPKEMLKEWSLIMGKAGGLILILGAIILIALVPWIFILIGNLDLDIGLDFLSSTEQPIPEIILPTATPPPTPAPTPAVVPEATPAPALEEIIIAIASEFPEVYEELNEIASQYNAVAVSLTAFDGNTGEYFTYEFGYADTEARRHVDTDTKFRIASLAKLTTVICAMVLVDDGLIDLDTDISIYLGYEVVNTNFPGDAITTRMLMQHTSSIFDSGAFQTSRDRNTSESIRFLLERGSSFRISSRPGTDFEYTNFGYSVLAAVCENVAGVSLDAFAREVLFDPLGIDASYVLANQRDKENIAVIYNDRHLVTFSLEEQLAIEESGLLGHDLHLAQGNLTISTIDYARILAMLGNGGVYNNVRILSPASVRAIHDTNVEGAAYRQGLATRFSVGDFILDEGFFWHTGSAYGTFSQYIYTHAANSNRGIVVVTTGAMSERDTNGMVSLCTDMSAVLWFELWLGGRDNDSDENDDDSDD